MTPWGDALFELADAALCAPGPVGSVPQLSLEPVFRRSHGSLYKALSLGDLSQERLRALLVGYRPADWPQVFAVDASAWARCDAECSPERGFCYSASRHSAGKPIVAGWNYQWISQLCFASDSWTAPLDAVRISPLADATDSTIDQVKRLAGLLGEHKEPAPMFVFDAGYDPIALSVGLGDLRLQVLVRIKSDRVFYADPAPRRTGARGRPQRHGRRYKLSEPKSTPKCDAALELHDRRYGTVRVHAWHNLHPKINGRGRWAGTKLPIVRRQRHPRRRRTTSEALSRCQEDPVVVVVRARRAGSLALLSLLPATLRHRAHLSLREEQARVDDSFDTDARTGGPLDVVGDRRLHATSPGAPTRRGPAAALGTSSRPRTAHSAACPTGFSATSCDDRYSGQSTEIRYAWPRKTKRHCNRAENALPGDQEERTPGRQGLIAS